MKTDQPLIGGVLATAGDLVFNGEANGWFKAFDAKTGKELWRYNAGAGVNAPAVSYMVNGKQYVAVAAGGNNQIDAKRGNSVVRLRAALIRSRCIGRPLAELRVAVFLCPAAWQHDAPAHSHVRRHRAGRSACLARLAQSAAPPKPPQAGPVHRVPRAGRQRRDSGRIRSLAGQTWRYIYVQLKDFKEGRRTDPQMSPIAKDLSRDDMIALGNWFAAQKPAPNQFKADSAKVAAGQKVSDAVLCPMCHLGGFTGQNEIPRVAGPELRVRGEAAPGLQAQAPHQRRRQHDERRGHAVRPGHREPRAVHHHPELGSRASPVPASHCRCRELPQYR